jgi:hypothetical protein
MEDKEIELIEGIIKTQEKVVRILEELEKRVRKLEVEYEHIR